jgi:hypothetical protein
MKLGFPLIAVLPALLLAGPRAALAEDQTEAAGQPITVAQADGPMVITPQQTPNRSYPPSSAPQAATPQAGAETRYNRVPEGGAGPGTPYHPYAPTEAESKGTFSIEEIKDSGHRFFGKVSMGFAEVVEYAFQRAGRPNGYILGEEAGGAFIAGLRYGEGTLYTKDAGSYKVYWQGPSLGYDFGGDGSKTMVLVYDLLSPGEIFNTYAGVDGSAYLVAGVSITFLANDHVKLAPISSGIGLRLGANVGYLKYTREPTWNPF